MQKEIWLSWLGCWKCEKLDLLKPSGIKLFLDGIDRKYLTFSIWITDEILNPKLYIIIMALHLLRPLVHHFHCPFFLIFALVLKVKRPKNPLRFLVVFSPRLSDEKLKEKKILRNFHLNRIYHGHCGTIAQFSYCFYYVSGISRRFRSILPSSFEP